MCQTDEVDMIERKAVNLLDRVSVDGGRIRTKGPPPHHLMLSHCILPFKHIVLTAPPL